MLFPYLIMANLALTISAVKMSDRFTVSSTCDGKDVDSMIAEALDIANTASQVSQNSGENRASNREALLVTIEYTNVMF